MRTGNVDLIFKVDLKIDFLDHKKHEDTATTCEFAKSCGVSKIRKDHIELFLEGKTILQRLKTADIGNAKVMLMQFSCVLVIQ